MRIPFANRTADVDLPAVPGQPKVTIKNIIDDFRAQVPSNFAALFEAFVLLSPRKVWVTCRSPRALEEVQHLGLAFRNREVTFHPCRTAKWVNVTRLSYGIPPEAVQAALSPYGKVINLKMDSYQGVYMGVRNVLMEITTPIPSNIRIADHWCNVFYPGQVPTCFRCRQLGHTRAKCPVANDNQAPPAVDAAANEAPLPSPARRAAVEELVDNVLDRVLSGRPTFAEVVGLGAGSGTSDGPEVATELSLVPNTQEVACAAADGGQDRAPPPMQDLCDSGSESGDSDFSDILKEATRVGEAYFGKRERVGTGSDDSDPELSHAQKKGKEIQKALDCLQTCQGESKALAVDVAATVPLPSDDDDDDDDDTTLTLIKDTPTDPDIGHDHSLTTDSDKMTTPLPKPTQSRGNTSQSSSGNVPWIRTRTRPTPPVAPSRVPKC